MRIWPKQIILVRWMMILATPVAGFLGFAAHSQEQEQEKIAPMISASTVLDWKLYNRARMQLGNVADLLVDKQTGRIAYITVDYDYEEAPLFKGTYFVVPWADVKFVPSREKIVFNMYEEMYETGSRYAMAGADNIAEYQGKYYIFYAQEPAEAPTGPAATYGSVGFHVTPGSALAEMKERTISASLFEGKDILDKQAQGIGSLKDLMIHVLNGRVVFGIAELNRSNSWVAIPWPAFENLEGKKLKVNVEKKKLTEYAFGADESPQMLDPQKSKRLYKAYGVKTHWEKKSR